MTDRYFVWEAPTAPALLLRRSDAGDVLFRDGSWRPTKAIVDWEFGENDWVSEVTEAKARTVAPEAFSLSQAS